MKVQTHHLIMAGMLDQKDLHDQIVNETLRLEIHDRSYQHPSDLDKLQVDLREDGLLNQNLNPTHPFGIAEFCNFLITSALKDLCDGKTELQLQVPVLPDASINYTKMLPAEWTKSFTTLKIDVKTTLPLIKTEQAEYSRFILICPFEAIFSVEKIYEFILETNAEAVGLDQVESESLLTSYTLSTDQKQTIVDGINIGCYFWLSCL